MRVITFRLFLKKASRPIKESTLRSLNLNKFAPQAFRVMKFEKLHVHRLMNMKKALKSKKNETNLKNILKLHTILVKLTLELSSSQNLDIDQKGSESTHFKFSR